MNTTFAHRAVALRPLRTARAAALAAALFLVANMALAITVPEHMGDHATTAGRLSEALVGASFLAGAAALAALLPRPASARWFWMAGITGLAGSGLTMIAVFATTLEPPFQLFLAEVAVTVPALAAIGVSGVRRRNWPWWVGLGLALLQPIMFALPFNSLIMAVVWLMAAWQFKAAPDMPAAPHTPAAAGLPDGADARP